jgi:hypothetical protein
MACGPGFYYLLPLAFGPISMARPPLGFSIAGISIKKTKGGLVLGLGCQPLRSP